MSLCVIRVRFWRKPTKKNAKTRKKRKQTQKKAKRKQTATIAQPLPIH
jgi:hypothetical protein